MEVINELLKAALLGSEKTDVKQLFNILPENIQQKLSLLSAEDTEESFLQLSSFVLPYYQAGNEFPVVETNIVAAEKEVVPYAPAEACKLLGMLLNENRHPLVREWLKQCAKQSRIVAPQFLPPLLDLSKEDVELQHLLKTVMGERGQWLVRLHAEWQAILESTQAVWETGKTAQRKQLFSYLLHHDTQQAKSLLQNTWHQESAADRFDFLSIWAELISSEEIDFLETARQDKSNKVKTLALQLLIRQPESKIYQEIRQSCSQLLTVKEGGIFGIGQKSIGVNAEVDLLPLIEKLELEKDSLHKTFTDQEYHAFQLLSIIDLGSWEEQLGITSEKILRQFVAGKTLKKYIPAFAQAIILHRNKAWAAAWLQNIPDSGIQYEHLQDDILQILSIAPQETLSERFENKQVMNLVNPTHLINLLGSFDFSWSLKFSKTVLHALYRNYADRGVYHYEMDKFLQLSMHLHPDIVKEKNAFLPAVDEKRETWRAMIEELFRNIALKTKIQASFEA